jgi:hypothetical protein
VSKKLKKYPGKLAKPFDVRREFSLRPEFSDMDAAFDAAISERLVLLLSHYEIELTLPEEKIWYGLALNLAFAHVPGFSVKKSKQKGPKRKWTLEECRTLVAAVDAQKTNKGLKEAIKKARMGKGWKWGTHVPSIEVRYHEAKRRIKFDAFVRNHPHGALGALMSDEMDKLLRKRTTKKPG